MATFKDLSDRFKALNFNAMSEQVISQQFVKDWIIETAQDRIYNTGVVANEDFLETDRAAPGNIYSYLTIAEKAVTGKRFTNVTLQDTGAFYNSWQVIATRTFYVVKAKFNKEDGHIYENFKKSFSNRASFEENVLGLTFDEMNIFIQKIFLPSFLQELKNELL